jgi:DNA-binding PadR family transcriptional regulator
LRAGDGAYGVPVHREIQRRTGRDLTLGTIYKTLSRLEAKRLLTSRLGDPTPERGGKATRCYAVTAEGKRSLQATLRMLRKMAAGLDVGLEPT